MTDTSTKSCPSCFRDIDGRSLRCPFCQQRQVDVARLYRDVPGRVLGGVCAALARHFNWDPTLIRIAFVVGLVSTGPLGLWVYAAVWLMTPFAQDGQAPLAALFDTLGGLFSPKQSRVDRVS